MQKEDRLANYSVRQLLIKKVTHLLSILDICKVVMNRIQITLEWYTSFTLQPGQTMASQIIPL